MTEPRSRWTTPIVLRVLFATASASAVLLFFVALAAIRADRSALASIAHVAAPNIIAAREVGARLADLDTELANSLLGSTAERGISDARFEDQRIAANRRLVDAANAIAQGSDDREPIVKMTEELGRYYEEAGRAQWLQDRGDRDGALLSMRQATQRMHEHILPAANTLDAVDRRLMDDKYKLALDASQRYSDEAFFSGVLLVATLLVAQLFMRLRMRRLLNPILALATILAVTFTWYLLSRFSDARENFRIARDDAFNSIHLLWRASSLAYDARGDESRWLLDRAHASEYESSFREKMSLLISKQGDWHTDSAELRSKRVTGLLVDEVDNVTFPGEGPAIEVVIADEAAFVGVDATIRSFARKGDIASAVEDCVGSNYDGARASFDRLDASIQKTIAINVHAFDSAVTSSDRALVRAEWLDPAVAFILLILVWLGIRPRLREYA